MIASERLYSIRPPLSAASAGAAVAILGGLIGLGGAEFRLPILIARRRLSRGLGHRPMRCGSSSLLSLPDRHSSFGRSVRQGQPKREGPACRKMHHYPTARASSDASSPLQPRPTASRETW
jgi:hypothetical protein